MWAALVSNVPIVTTNLNRNFLLIQNNSSATSPDTAPTFYVSFDSPLNGVNGLQIALLPGGGSVTFDQVVPINAIYVTLGTYLNGGSTAVVAGALIQGTALPQ